LLWGRQWIIYLCILLTSGAAFAYYAAVGERYEAYTLLRVGQGIKERSGPNVGDGVDLQSRMESLSRIAKIDQVVQEAANDVGYDRLAPESRTTLLSQFQDAVLGYIGSAWAWGKEAGPRSMAAKESAEPPSEPQAASEAGAQDVSDSRQSAILALRERVVAKQEGRSDLLRITFRHTDPRLAAAFLDALANALVAIHNTDQVPGAQEFFQQQTKRLEEEAEVAAANLENFSVEASIYAVDEQRQLLLKRANELSTLISTTRAQIEERKGQRQAMTSQLGVLRPVAQSKTVTQMVRTIGGNGQDTRRTSESGNTAANSPRMTEQLEETPPLLLVKVYQDAMAALMKVNSDLTGATALLNQLGMELESVNKELASLASKEAEYGRLKRVFTTSSAAAAHYASRMLEEQISSEVSKKTQLSNLRVVQRAVPPTAPVFPQVPHLIGLALVGGILLGFGIIIGPELAKGTTHAQRSHALVVGDDEPVTLFVARQRKEGPKDSLSA